MSHLIHYCKASTQHGGALTPATTGSSIIRANSSRRLSAVPQACHCPYTCCTSWLPPRQSASAPLQCLKALGQLIDVIQGPGRWGRGCDWCSCMDAGQHGLVTGWQRCAWTDKMVSVTVHSHLDTYWLRERHRQLSNAEGRNAAAYLHGLHVQACVGVEQQISKSSCSASEHWQLLTLCLQLRQGNAACAIK